MRISQAGIILLITLTIVFGASCGIYNKVIARKNLVDGANAFNGRKFPEAEQLFREAVSHAPEDSVEYKTALLFLARTLHSEYAANRVEKSKAEQAIEQYQKVLKLNPSDGSSFKAVASLYDNLDKKDEWQKWLTDRTTDDKVPAEQRAEAYTSLAAKQNTCANDITELPAVKKTVQKDNKPTFVFSKPEKPEDLETLRTCVQKGTELISKAVALEENSSGVKTAAAGDITLKNAASADLTALTDKELKELGDLVNTFESARSFNASLLIQASRLAEIEGKTAEKDSFKQKADDAKKSFSELNSISKKIKDEKEAREARLKEESNTNANTSANPPANK